MRGASAPTLSFCYPMHVIDIKLHETYQFHQDFKL